MLDLKTIQTKELQCKGCTNQCAVNRYAFPNGNTCYSGNKCEKIFFNKNSAKEKGYNAFDFRNDVVFCRGEACLAPTMTIGIPRALNMYEHFPFWQTLFSECGFEVVLSPESDFPLYQKGAGSVMSDSICFPAKLVHGHIMSLIETRVNRIFYPIVPKDENEFQGSTNSYNCPIVSGYPDVIRSAINLAERHGIPFDKPVMNFGNEKALKESCKAYFSTLGIDKKRFEKAYEKALQKQNDVKTQLCETQKALLNQAIQENKLAFVVCGRPYHADGLINQKTGQILSDLGVIVLTDDVFRTTPEGEKFPSFGGVRGGFDKLNLVSQWSYPNRVVQAALEVAKLPQNVQLIQLNSFGCGPDSFYMDEVGEILKQAGKNHTLLRIDEIASPGSVRLRLRSLIESLGAIGGRGEACLAPTYNGYKTSYTKNDRKKTILVPWFADFISPFLPAIGKLAGYKIENAPRTSKQSVETGLKYAHNEVCYPATLVIGDLISALQSGDYDLNDMVLGITQTGGQCRATNYVAQLKNALAGAGFTDIPIVVFATGEVFQNEQSAFTFPIVKMANILTYTLLYADALQQMYSSTIIRERVKGITQVTFDRYIEQGIEAVEKNNSKLLRNLLKQAVEDFNKIAIFDRKYTKIGLIGEIYVKYNNFGQAYMTQWLQQQNMEVITPSILDFVMQYFVNSKVNIENGIGRNSVLGHYFSPILWKYLTKKMRKVEQIMSNYRFYYPAKSIYEKADYASEILDLSNQFGEGWLIAGEVACYAREGINRVVCIQPFGCIANHVVAKGVEKQMKKIYPEMNLLYLDIDSGMADVNLQNRLHFLIN